MQPIQLDATTPKASAWASYFTLSNIVIFAALLRLLAAMMLPLPDLPDAHAYRTAAAELLQTGQMQNHIYMPLYPLLVALSGAGVGQLLMDGLFSLLLLVVLHELALELFASQVIARLTAFAAAVYPFFIFYALSGLTEISFTLCLCSAFLLLYRQCYLQASVLLVLGILIRPTLDLIAPLLIFIFAVVVHQRSLRSGLVRLLIYMALYNLMLLPWWLHNYHKYGEFVRLDCGFGHVLYAGNNPGNVSGVGVNKGRASDDVDYSRFDQVRDPVARDQAKVDAAINYIKQHPARFAKLAWVKFTRFWRLWPYAPEYQRFSYIALSLASFGIALVLCLYFLATQLALHWRRLLPILLFASYLTAIHMVTIGSMRYRFPLEPFILLFAAAGLDQLWWRYCTEVKGQVVSSHRLG